MLESDAATRSGIGGLRSEMSRSSDAKVLRTRSAIFSAAEEIAESGGSLTVNEIVRTAGVSRSAFYSHFSGVDEVATALMSDAVCAIGHLDIELRRDAAASVGDVTRRTLGLIVDHVLAFGPLYLHVLPTSLPAHNAALGILEQHIRQTLEVMGGVPAEVERNDAARFLAGGCLELLLARLADEPRPSRDAMIARLGAVFPHWE